MWGKLWSWVVGNKLPAIAIVVFGLIALESATVGLPARRAAAGYLQLAREWATAYKRDTDATKNQYENKINALTLERNAYRDKWKSAKSKMNKPWTAPRNPKEIEERLLKMGYRGTVK